MKCTLEKDEKLDHPMFVIEQSAPEAWPLAFLILLACPPSARSKNDGSSRFRNLGKRAMHFIRLLQKGQVGLGQHADTTALFIDHRDPAYLVDLHESFAGI
jgi:hypothetical protein